MTNSLTPDQHNPVGTSPTEKFGRTNFKAVRLEEAGRG
jgi:hypothetical protein